MNTPRNSSAAHAALQGDALHAFLEQTHELLNAADAHTSITQQDRLAAATELMSQQSFAPRSVLELERVHDFWLLLNQPERANQFLQAHRTAALQADDRSSADTEVRLALSDIQSRLEFDPASAVPLLLPTAQAMSALPHDLDIDGYWSGWHAMAHKAQAWDAAEAGLDLQRTRERNHPDDDGAQAYGDAMTLVRKAELAHQRGETAKAAQQVQAAVTTLRDAPPDQAADFDQWMALAEQVLRISTASLPVLLMACEQQLQRSESPPPSQAVQAHRKVRVVRLQAQACALAGQLDAALQLAPQGHFGLTDDEGDPFTSLQIDWLVQAGQLEQAAALSLESVMHARPVSAVRGYQLAHAQFGSGSELDTTWALILAFALSDEDMRYLLSEETMPTESVDFYLQAVRARDPNNAVAALIEGMRLAAKRKMEQALPLLEQSVGQRPDWADSDKLNALWAARFAALPLEEALARPFIDAHGAHWCYAAGVVLDDDDDLGRLMGGKKKLPADELRAPLVQRYYEEGLARFEHFWSTGQGMFKDADLHVYSMLCNNLAIKYRNADRYDEAAVLHHKGLASSPFAEHRDGLMWCAIGNDDDEGIVAEAERLWHFAQEYGYSRNDPTNYFSTVALSLYKLDRDDEISIWMERLDQWFEELDEEEQASERRDYLASLMSMLDFFSSTHPELVLPRVRALQAEVVALRDCYPLRRLAGALEAYPELLEESLALYRQAHSFLDRDDGQDERRMAAEGIARAERKIVERDAEAQAAPAASNGKPWWRFW